MSDEPIPIDLNAELVRCHDGHEFEEWYVVIDTPGGGIAVDADDCFAAMRELEDALSKRRR